MNLDIRTITVLVKMYELGSVKAVAESQGKTSGAISKTLTKAKEMLDDPLFTPSGNGFEPTSFLQQNIRHLKAILECCDQIGQEQFEPATHRDPVTIYAQPHFFDLYGVPLYRNLRAECPDAKIEFKSWNPTNRNRLLDGEGDIAVHVEDENLPQALQQNRIASRPLGFMVRQQHPAQTLEELVNYPVVMLHTPGLNDYRYRMLERLRSYGLDFQPSLVLEHTSIRDQVVLSSNHCSMTTVKDAPPGTRSIMVPPELRLELSYMVTFRRSQRDNPRIRWLSDHIHRLFR